MSRYGVTINTKDVSLDVSFTEYSWFVYTGDNVGYAFECLGDMFPGKKLIVDIDQSLRVEDGPTLRPGDLLRVGTARVIEVIGKGKSSGDC